MPIQIPVSVQYCFKYRFQTDNCQCTHLGQTHGREDGIHSAVQPTDEPTDNQRNDRTRGLGDTHQYGGDDGHEIIDKHRLSTTKPIGEISGRQTADQSADGPNGDHDGEDESDRVGGVIVRVGAVFNGLSRIDPVFDDSRCSVDDGIVVTELK